MELQSTTPPGGGKGAEAGDSVQGHLPGTVPRSPGEYRLLPLGSSSAALNGPSARHFQAEIAWLANNRYQITGQKLPNLPITISPRGTTNSALDDLTILFTGKQRITRTAKPALFTGQNK